MSAFPNDPGLAVLANIVEARSVPGAPTSGTWQTDNAIIDSNGAIWVCTAGGTPGTWTEGAEPPSSIAVGTPVSGSTDSSLLVTDGSGDLGSGPLTSSVVTSTSLNNKTLPAQVTGVGVGSGSSLNSRNSFYVNTAIDSSDSSSNNGYDFIGAQFNHQFTGQNWQSTTSPDNGFFIGYSFFVTTGHTAGDGNGMANLQAMEIGVQSNSATATPPSAAPFSSRFNVQYMQALQLASFIYGSSTIYSMATLYVASPAYTTGLSTAQQTRAIADGAITGTTTLTSATAAFTSGDTGSSVVGPTNIPYGTTITYVNATTATLSQACTNGTGLSIAIGNGGACIGPAYGQFVSLIDGQAVGSTNTFSFYGAGGNNYMGGPVSIDLTQMTVADIGLNPAQMASRSGVVGAVAALNIKAPATGFAGRFVDIWKANGGSGVFQVFSVSNSGNTQAGGLVVANLSATGQTEIGAVGTSSAAGIAFGTSSGFDTVIQRLAANVVGLPGAMFIAEGSIPSTISGSGGLWVNSADGSLHYINPSGTDGAIGGGPGSGPRQIVVSCFGAPETSRAHNTSGQ
jgi:hypothetical protein